jgi:hypothetical protein
MEYVDYEFIALSEIEEVPCDWDFEDESEQFDAIEEMEATLRVAELFEELGLA